MSTLGRKRGPRRKNRLGPCPEIGGAPGHGADQQANLFDSHWVATSPAEPVGVISDSHQTATDGSRRHAEKKLQALTSGGALAVTQPILARGQAVDDGNMSDDGDCGRRARLLTVEKSIARSGASFSRPMRDPREDARGEKRTRCCGNSVFVSYVEEDSELALALASKLQKEGYSTWCYEDDALPGVSYLIQTGQAIERAHVFLLLISTNSLGSHQLTKEVVRAHEEGKPIVPLLVDVAHVEFQRRQPEWREAVGGAASIRMANRSLGALVALLAKSFYELGVPRA